MLETKDLMFVFAAFRNFWVMWVKFNIASLAMFSEKDQLK